jgi:hypothetical protein
MDFNTGGSGGQNPNDPSRSLVGGESPRSSPGPAGGPRGPAGGEFTISDPVGSFISTARNLVLNPVGFFRGIARRGDFVGPLVFAVICALISALIGGLLGLVLTPLFANTGGTGEAFVSGLLGFVGGLILGPIIRAIFSFAWSGILYLFVMLLVKPSNAGYEATFRVVSYSSVVQLVSWIPVVGTIVAFVWGTILSILGIREAHSTTTKNAMLVVLIPTGLILLLVVVPIAVLLGAAAFTLLQQRT